MSTTTEYEFQVLSPGQVDAIRSLQSFIGAANAEKGFHDEGDNLRSMDNVVDDDGFTAPYLRNYYTARLSLITTEVAEAIEELRNGRAVDETWFSAKIGGTTYAWNEGEQPFPTLGYMGKPEGVPSEVADVVVRSLDFADEAKFDLAEILDRKLAFNATRGRMHGRKF